MGSRFEEFLQNESSCRHLPESTRYQVKDAIRQAFNAGVDAERKRLSTKSAGVDPKFAGI